MTTVLGISAFYHDSAAALLRDGEIIAAAQEERFSRVKGDASFPRRAISYCLEEAGLHEDDIDHVVFYENPLTHFERLVSIYHLSAPFSLRSYLKAMPDWLTRKLWMDRVIRRELGCKAPIHYCDHHVSHAAAAYYPSPYDEACILTVDGVGEWATATIGRGRHGKIDLLKQQRFPNSLGLLYSAFTYFTGFRINSGEYKLMGLAPYGTPKYADLIRKHLIHAGDDGSLVLNQGYFNYVGGLRMTNERFAELFDGPPRQPESPVTQREMDIAASIQQVTNDVLYRMARHAREVTELRYLVMAGGVALNVVAVGHLARSGLFDGIWVQPAAGDAGSALGAALWFQHQILGRSREAKPQDGMKGAFLGPDIKPASDRDDAVLLRFGALWDEMDVAQLQERIAELIAAGQVVAIARGRMEWGPRALGARSILGDARSPTMQSHMNHKIKFRESFRPFAPMVLAEDASAYFDLQGESPYMLRACPVRLERQIALTENEQDLWGIDLLKIPRSDIPAVTHVDYSARVQTVDRDRNSFMHGVLKAFRELTGCSVIINTSFNVRGEPIVNNVEDAYRCFMASGIDALVVGNRLLLRERQPNPPSAEHERANWLRRFDLD